MLLGVNQPSIVITEQPWVLLPGPETSRQLFSSHSYDYQCSVQNNPLQVPVTLDLSVCTPIDLPQNMSAPQQFVFSAPNAPLFVGQPYQGVDHGIVSLSQQWKLNYSGVFSAFYTQDGLDNQTLILTIDHNETKNEEVPPNAQLPNNVTSTAYYQSPYAPLASILAQENPNASQEAAGCSLNHGYTGNVAGNGYVTCWDGYAAFLTYEWTRYVAGAPPTLYIDSGPVVWPTAGYYDLSKGNLFGGPKGRDLGNLSGGLRQPSGVIANNYLYVYYTDTSQTSLNNALPFPQGEKVARAPILANGLPGSFCSWDGVGFNLPSLPGGFDTNNVAAFLSSPGPQSPALFTTEAQQTKGYSLNTTRFSVAYDPTRKLYVGAESFQDKNGVSQVALRLSSDLAHWSPRTVLTGSSEVVNKSGKTITAQIGDLQYANFANGDFNTNSIIDLANFYIIGSYKADVYYVNLSVQ